MGNNYNRELKKATEIHSMEWENALIFGKQNDGTGSNGQKERETDGILNFVKTNVPANFADFQNSEDSDYQAQTWLQAGKTFLNNHIKVLHRYLQGESMWLCGDGALQGINDLAETYGSIRLETKEVSYGIKVTEWHTANGSIFLKTHPLLSQEPSTQYLMIGLDPSNVQLCPLQGNGEDGDIDLEEDIQPKGRDAKTDQFIGEMGTKFYHPDQFMILDGIGKDHTDA